MIREIGISMSLDNSEDVEDEIEIIKKFDFSHFSMITPENKEILIRELSLSMKNGEGIREASRRLVKSIEGLDRKSAVTIAQSAIMTAYNKAQLNIFKSNGVEKVEWISGIDDTTCEYCKSNDGKQWDIDKAPQCPAHLGCRCVLVAVPEGLPDETEID